VREGAELMASARFDPDHGAEEAAGLGDAPRLDGITPTQVAYFILGLGGCLVALDARAEGEHEIVVYTFEVASKEQVFVAPVRDHVVESIAPVFPEAATRGAELGDRLGIHFEAPPVS
jgi:hypothetical protein